MSSSASDISVTETLELLDTSHSPVAAGVANGRYTFWLGSGISRGAVPGLDGVVRRVLEHLQVRVDAGNPTCRFRVALVNVLKEARLTEDERARLDIESPAAGWVDLDVIVARLTSRYAEMLDVRVDGEAPDYLLWDAVDVRSTYPATLPPDCEHLCLAILGIEGVVAELVSPNWDGLIEAAFEQLGTGASAFLHVCVLDEDLRAEPRRVRLLKFHGCAVLADRDPGAYRSMLIGRKSQITDWPEAPESAAMRQEMTRLATTTPTFMVGLSAQDSNIQALFSRAKNTLQWTWPNPLPALVFSEDELGGDQQNILRVAYGTAYDEHRLELEMESLIRAYAKPLLVGLVLDVLTRKARALVEASDAPELAAPDLDELKRGVTTLRDLAAQAAGTGTLDFVEDLVAVVRRLVSLFQHGAEPSSGMSYRALTMLPADQLAADPSLPTNGVRELAAALALIGRGHADGSWTVGQGPTSSSTRGALRITSSHETAVFFVARNAAAIELERRGAISSATTDALVIHSDEPAARLSRSPSGPPGRTGMSGTREVALGKLLRGADSLDDLERDFRLLAGL